MPAKAGIQKLETTLDSGSRPLCGLGRNDERNFWDKTLGYRAVFKDTPEPLMQVTRWNVETDGPLTEAALRRKLEANGYHVTRYVYPPGTSFPDHSHAMDKIDAVLKGRFRMILEGAEIVLEPGDAVAVPRGAVHSAEVVGDEAVVSLDAAKG